MWVLRGQWEDACTEDASVARATAAALTGVLHYSFEDVAVVETEQKAHRGHFLELHMSLYILYSISADGGGDYCPAYNSSAFLFFGYSKTLYMISVPNVIRYTGYSFLFGYLSH